MKNKVNLITYVDRLCQGGIKDLISLLNGPMKDIFAGVHMLPFYDPIDGTDAGFDPIDHRKVDPRLGSWDDVKELALTHEITTDLIVNHISAESEQFQSVLDLGEESPYNQLFLTPEDIYPQGIRQSDLEAIYRPRPGSPFSIIKHTNGLEKEYWTTFTSNQIDINVYSREGQEYLSSIIKKFAESGVSLIRLDAVGYAVKKAGTSCFMIPETYTFIEELTNEARRHGMKILVEIHSYYKEQIAIAQKVDYVYDFALPPLILHAIYSNNGQYLKDWLDICPHNTITVLDTHDGIGVIDIGPLSLDKSKKGLIPDKDIDYLVEEMHTRSKDTSRKATGTAASNLDLYQVNSTYYDSLGKNDNLYLLARAIQFFSPGIPQVYYQGLLAEPNDMALLDRTKVGRDINRHYFVNDDVAKALDRPVVKKLIDLIRYRNSNEAFNGSFEASYENNILILKWQKKEATATLKVHWDELTYSID